MASFGPVRAIREWESGMSTDMRTMGRRSILGWGGALLAAFLATSAPMATTAVAHEVMVTVTSVRVIGRTDAGSAPDFFARVTIDGETKASEHVRNRALVKPNWKFSKKVKPGVHKVKLEIFDKDVAKNDPIDINRWPGKRDLDFEVDTRSCRVGGFARAYRCKATIRRAGTEGKRAEVAFRVDVRK
jgi:hypothetical protein